MTIYDLAETCRLYPRFEPVTLVEHRPEWTLNLGVKTWMPTAEDVVASLYVYWFRPAAATEEVRNGTTTTATRNPLDVMIRDVGASVGQVVRAGGLNEWLMGAVGPFGPARLLVERARLECAVGAPVELRERRGYGHWQTEVDK